MKEARIERRASRTDWARVDALTEEEIAEAVRNDPDAVPLDFDWSEAVLVAPRRRRPKGKGTVNRSWADGT